MNAFVPEEILDALHQFMAQQSGVILATVNADQTPEVSYAPVLQSKGRFYIFVSALARHTDNLKKRAGVSLLFIEDEAKCRQIFARQRVTWQVEAQVIARSTPEWDLLMQLFQQQFGSVITMLRSLPDFSLIELVPKEANYVRGFGQAYQLTGKDLQEVRLRDGSALSTPKR
ncbi:MAG: pyridoxamine 5'-phosphate oxidase family protein [Thiotrichales bacterium]|nr:pyridoxamine 5'-phosphate oxidase family protein [Thiotrichales bacterium]